MSKLTSIDLADAEQWREYDFTGRVYRIDRPAKVEFRPGGSTHRVTDADGVVHLLPAPGFQGCVIRFMGSVIA